MEKSKHIRLESMKHRNILGVTTILSWLSSHPFNFAKNYEKIWIKLGQQFIGIYSKSNMTTCQR